jgi:hypothetical protein
VSRVTTPSIEDEAMSLDDRRLFWPLVGAASVQVALAGACFAVAVFSDPIPRGSATYAPTHWVEVFDRRVSLTWAADRGMIVSALVLAFTGIATFAFAARRR